MGDNKMTTDELYDHFGGSIPMEAVNLLLVDDHGGMTMAEVREKILEMAPLHRAKTRRDELKEQVVDWMTGEGGNGRLRFNHQAPMWPDYEAAENEVELLSRAAATPA